MKTKLEHYIERETKSFGIIDRIQMWYYDHIYFRVAAWLYDKFDIDLEK